MQQRNMSSKPNFVFIITDQQRADYLGCYGHPVVDTGNIDRLAQTGVIFDKFYVSSPTCMVNRATLATGRLPSLHGVRSNGIPLNLNSNTYVDVLRNYGYKTALIGKSHLQNFTGQSPINRQHQYNKNENKIREFTEATKCTSNIHNEYNQEQPYSWILNNPVINTPYYGFDYVKLCTGHGDLVEGDYKRWLLHKLPNAKKFIGYKNQKDHKYKVPQAWRTAIPESLYPTSYITEQTIKYLENYKSIDEKRPFYLQMSFPDPHHPFTPPGRYWDMYNPDEMVMPKNFYQLPSEIPKPLDWIYKNRGLDSNRKSGIFAFVADEEEIRQAAALTCGMISMIDNSIGKVISKLEELNLSDNTIIVFTVDHGDFLGDHRLLLKGPLHYQSLIRVPFIWSDPSTSENGRINNKVGGTIDIAKTILDRVGLQAYNGIQGKNLLKESVESNDELDECILIQEDQQRNVFGFDSPPRVHSLVTEEWRLTLYDGLEQGELYNLINDPLENNNLWGDKHSEKIKSELLELFVRKCIDGVDKSPVPTGLA